MEGLERLEAEILELNDYNVSTIFNYLKTKTELYEKFNNSEKSLKQMYSYICDMARKQSKNNVAMIADRVVYLWATNYFNKSNEELGLNKPKTISPTTKETKKENEKNKVVEENKELEKEEVKKATDQLTLF